MIGKALSPANAKLGNLSGDAFEKHLMIGDGDTNFIGLIT